MLHGNRELSYHLKSCGRAVTPGGGRTATSSPWLCRRSEGRGAGVPLARVWCRSQPCPLSELSGQGCSPVSCQTQGWSRGPAGPLQGESALGVAQVLVDLPLAQTLELLLIRNVFSFKWQDTGSLEQPQGWSSSFRCHKDPDALPFPAASLQSVLTQLLFPFLPVVLQTQASHLHSRQGCEGGMVPATFVSFNRRQRFSQSPPPTTTHLELNMRVSQGSC